MGSHQLLDLVAHCPSGAETLIMRMLHILTESGREGQRWEGGRWIAREGDENEEEL